MSTDQDEFDKIDAEFQKACREVNDLSDKMDKASARLLRLSRDRLSEAM